MKNIANKVETVIERSRFNLPKFLRWVLVLLLYLITFSVLDQLTHTLQLFSGVVAWYPPDGLSLAFLLTFGAGFIPAFAFASLISSLIIYRFSAPLAPILIWAVILSAVYGIDAFLLRRRVRIDPQLKNLRDTLWLILTSAIVSTVLAVISVSTLINYGEIPAPQFFNASVQWWIGEMIGVLVFTPFLLVHGMPWLKRFIDGGWANSKKRIIFRRPSLQSIGQVISIPVILVLVFGIPALRGFQPLYLIAGPLIWIALTNGFSRVSLAIVAMNFGTILAIGLFKFDTSRLGELQFLTFGIYASTLLTGAIVTKQKRTEEELRHSEVRNWALIEHAPDAITLLGADGLLKYLSPATQRILGYSPEEQVGSNPAELTHPDDLPALLKLLENLGQEPGKVAKTQYRFRHKDGSWRWLESTITNLLAEPSVQAIVFNFRDITERKQADETLQKSEKRFRSLVEHSMEEISLVDPDGTLTYESPNMRRPLGYPPNSFVGHNLFDIFHPDDREAAIRLLEQIGKHPGSVLEASFRLRHQDGSWRWMEGILSNLLDEPAVQSIVINYRDVTERKQTDDWLRASEERNRILVEQASDGIFVTDSSGKFVDVNVRGCAMLGYSREEILSKRLIDLFTPEELTSNPIKFEEVRAGKTVVTERSWICKDGSLLPVEISAHMLSDGRLQGIIRDITERKRAEQEIVSLAKFPSENPNPVLRLSRDGIVLYANATSGALLGMWRCAMGGSAPQFWRDLAAQALGSRKNKTVNIECDEKVYSMFVTPVAESGYVNLYGSDITEREHAEKKIRRQLEHLTALSGIDRVISANFDLKLSLSEILNHVTKELGVDAADILILNPGLQVLEFAAERGFRTNTTRKAQVRLGESYAGRAALERQLVQIPNLRNEPDNLMLTNLLTDEDFVCYYGVPLIAKGQVNGVLEVLHRAALEPDAEWFNFLFALAGQTAIAIENATLFVNLQRSNLELTMAYDATIEGWSRALDLRDNETEGHTQRVTELTTKLGRLFGLSEDELVHARWGALLHDIGKMGVPDGILLKPGPLTDDEWIVMRKHTTYGFELLSPIHFLRTAVDIPYCHHEKWDGSGYPRGLKGEAIPLAARIFSFVDVYDALTSDRPYRKAWPEKKVLDHIRSLSGTHFDPQVVKICLESGLLKGKKSP